MEGDGNRGNHRRYNKQEHTDKGVMLQKQESEKDAEMW